MITFKILVVWIDGDTDWFCGYFDSFDEFVEDRRKFYTGLSCWSRIVAFQDKEIPNHQVLEYLGDFYRLGNEVQFVKPIEQ